MAYPATNTNYFAKSATAKVMVNADVLFTVVGDVRILSLQSKCITANDTTASTLQYSITTAGGSTTISGASASLASAAAGVTAIWDGTNLATAPALTSATGVGLAINTKGVRSPSGTITAVVGVGSTTGTWIHYVSYVPLEANAYIV